ncbi:MAG: HpaII family restriction endonuclease [Brevinema sp.]
MALSEKRYTVNYHGMENADFEANLIVIDSDLPEIIAQVLASFFSGKGSSLNDLTSLLTKQNICNYPKPNRPYYEYKIKNFLYDVALGMTPFAPWTSSPDATGGYIIVDKNWEISCYHSYDREKFPKYLFTKTKLDTASSSRHGFGSIYKDNDEYFIKLNLQIRFK